MNLADLQILTLDCQTTGANPDKGHLLEIGWVKTSAEAAVQLHTLNPQSYFVRLPPDIDIPLAVERVTGLSKKSLEKTLPASVIWKKISAAAGEIRTAADLQRCPTVIHYARFEKPFLKQLHAESNSKGDFPLRIVCSHEIALRLLPGLPRKGLRAVAGFFGHSVPKLRRAAGHAAATAVIWQHLVQQLITEHGVRNLEQLIEWLKRTPVQGGTQRVYPMKPEVRRNLPDTPGVYRMRRSNGDLLYIGKATSLKQRVNSYFHRKGIRAEHTLEMISQAADLDVTPTGSALEAAVLESDEIKRFAPPYNVALQKGERKLVFGSRDLQRWTAQSGSTHCIGPLPAGNLPAAITAFGIWMADCRSETGGTIQAIGNTILGLPDACAAPTDCLVEGLGFFRDNHQLWLKPSSPLRSLLGLGGKLWRQRLAALEKARSEPREEEIEEASADDIPGSEEGPTWTPEAVARGIERFAMHSALMIRRARWLCLLSESTLAWDMRDSSGRARNVLLLKNGDVFRLEQLPISVETPAPPGHAIRMPQRQKNFDVTTYERLRVATTELRRLLTEGRNLEIRLKPTATLSRKQLATLLPWV